MHKATPLSIAVCILATSLIAKAEDGLVLHYKFNNRSGDTARDLSGQGHDGVIHGGAQVVTGHFGTALKLDGVDDYVRCEGAPDLDTADAFTVEAWVYAERSVGGIFSRHLGASWTDERLVLAMYERDKKNHYLCAISDGKTYLVARPGPPTLNRWVHLAVTFDGKYIRMYRDGELEHTNYASSAFKPLLAGVPVYIGRSQGIGQAPFFKGMIGEVRYYRRRLSSREIENRWARDWQMRREVMIAKRTAAAPKLDGVLDEPAWQSATAHDVPGIAPPPDGTATDVRVAYDDEHLYIAFTCAEAMKIGELAADAPRRKGVIWNFDLVEMFLDPGRTRQRYTHLAASPVGNQYYDDRTGFGGGATQDESWHEPWSFATHVDQAAKRWTMEVIIPFTSLDVAPPKAGDIWLANFGRERPEGWQTTQHLYLWSQIARGFNDPATFGALCFDHGSLAVAELIRATPPKEKTNAGWRNPNVQTVGHRDDGSVFLPTEQTLRPAGKSITFYGRPIDMALSPDERWLVATTSYQVILIDTQGTLKDAMRLPSGRANSLHGILFTPDSRSVYVAGHRGQIEKLDITEDGKLKLDGQRKPWKSAICGMTFSRDGKFAYVAASPSNRLLILDSDLKTELTSIAVGVAPFSVIHGPGNKLYVSNWGGRRPDEGDVTARTDGARVIIDPETGLPTSGTVSVFHGEGRSLKFLRTIDVGRFPCQLALSPDGKRLYVPNANDDTVSIVDTATDTVVNIINVKPDDHLPYGSQPIAQAVSPDGSTLYVANATNNAIAVVKNDRLAGLIPVGWFPGAIQLSRDGKTLYAANVRGLGAEHEPMRSGRHVGDYQGLVNIIDVPDEAQLARYTKQVAENNRQLTPLMRYRPRKTTDKLVPVPTKPGESSVFEHVIYVIKENHSYDQDLGDMTEGNGEPRLCSAPERVTPNEHKLAREFVLLDNYHVPSVQSPSGHIWISQGICSSYWEKAITSWPRYYSYSGKDALAFSSSGFLWTNATKHGLTFRNYGEYVNWNIDWVDPDRKDKITFTDVWNDFKAGGTAIRITNEPTVASLKPYTHPHYPGYGYRVTDVQRAHIFIEDLKRFEREDNMPRLIWLWLPNNHTSGSRPGFPTATAQIADNDMALGLVVEAVSRSKLWPKTAIFITEDDPWNGSDHVTGSRTMCFIASAYTKRKAVISNLYTLTGLLKTMELVLGLPMMNQLDLIATPMTDCFTSEPDLTPYTHIPSNIPLDKLNPPVSQLQGRERYWAERSLEMPLAEEPDAFPAQLEMFKRLAWYTTMGIDVPYTHVDAHGNIVTEDH